MIQGVNMRKLIEIFIHAVNLDTKCLNIQHISYEKDDITEQILLETLQKASDFEDANTLNHSISQ